MRKGSQLPQNLIVSRIREANQVLRINVFPYWLAYLPATHMKSQFPQAWLAHSHMKFIRLRKVVFPCAERDYYINDVILRIPLYCKLFEIAVPG